jgi:ABC-type antimicrobial peptide transport system permease subunit
VEIVGIVEDAAFTSVRNPVEPTMYRPLAQAADDTFFETMPVICVSVRAASTMSPERLREAVAPALAAVDRDSAVSTVTVGAQLDAYYVRERLLGLLSGLFAVIGLLLAAIGLYGVTSLSVHGRRHELAVRIAVGADGRRISRLVFRRLAVVVGCGALVGGAVAVAAGRIVESLLFGVTARDPVAFVSAFVTLLVTAIAAASGPVRRAARTEPMMALREP